MAISNPLGKGSRLSANGDCHALFLFLGKLASELSHLFQLG